MNRPSILWASRITAANGCRLLAGGPPGCGLPGGTPDAEIAGAGAAPSCTAGAGRAQPGSHEAQPVNTTSDANRAIERNAGLMKVQSANDILDVAGSVTAPT